MNRFWAIRIIWWFVIALNWFVAAKNYQDGFMVPAIFGFIISIALTIWATIECVRNWEK